MTKLTHTSIARNIPEFAREEYPLFIKLMEEYYRFLDTTYAGDVSRVKDIDSTPDEFIEYFKKQFSINISSFWRIDVKKFLFFAKEFYSSRGTEASIRFLFRAMFGEEIEVDFPGKNVLRVSDGKWFQEYHVEMKTLYGTFPNDGQIIEFSNDDGEFNILPTRVEIIPNTDRCFVFFEQPYKIHIAKDQNYTQRNDSGLVTYAGRGLPSSSRLVIKNPGKYWRVGSVIRIPGSTKDTFSRVTKTTPEGAIQGIEILEYGYDHVNNQALIISPFPNRPIGSVVDINSEIISTSPLAFHHTIDILDDTDGTIESMRGISTEQDFYIADFFLEDFFGKIVIDMSTTEQIRGVGYDSDISIADWLASRSTLVFEKDDLVRDRGYYLNTDSLISENEVRIHDSFFYQAFSYVVETERELREYKESITLTHPAGMKFFALMNREVSLSMLAEMDRIYGVDMINRLEVQEILEQVFKNYSKPFSESVNITVPDFDVNLTKNRVDDVTASDGIQYLDIGKNLSDEQIISDEFNKSTQKNVIDVTNITEQNSKIVSKSLSDVSTISDSINTNTWKSFVDDLEISTENSFTTFDASFFSDVYFLTNYFSPTINLEIQ